MKLKHLFISLCMFFSLSGWANDITISNVQISEKSTANQWISVSFDLSVENSWRINTGAANWNAAWIFVKYKIGATGEWHHATLSNNDGEHFAPSNTTIDATVDGKGAFIYDSRDNAGADFTFSRTGIKLRWYYGLDGIPDNTANLYFKVFGIEMVYIPGGSFYLGSGGAEEYCFYEGGTSSNPFLISSNAELQVRNNFGCIYYNNFIDINGVIWGGDKGGPIPLGYPKGYNAYYVMRYEISQEQYKDFLNCLNRTQQNYRTGTDISPGGFSNHYVMSNSATVSIRNGITCLGTGHVTVDPITFYCDYNGNRVFDELSDGQNIACNFLNWGDGLAYLDWAGLRPMTEFEFEKSGRGPNSPDANDFPWGTTFPTGTSLTINNDGETNEQVANNGNGLSNFNHDVDTYGPLRCGFAATSSSSKVQAGASYYGVMELAGNLTERCISAGTPEGRAYTGLSGDGEVSATGSSNVTNWPGSNGQSTRGGNFRRVSNKMMVSTRSFASYTDDMRFDYVGWRGARTVD